MSESVSRKSSSVSPGKPTMMSVEKWMSGMAVRMRATISRYFSRVQALHVPQHARRTGLHGQVQIARDVFMIAHRGDHRVIHLGRM
jgi:hypothetical protein